MTPLSGLEGCVDQFARHEKGAVPPRPSVGGRPTRVAIAAPADIGARWRLDKLRGVVGHCEFEGRNIALLARGAVGVRGDHSLDIDQPESRSAQRQPPWKGRLRRPRNGTERDDSRKGQQLSYGRQREAPQISEL